MEGIDKEILDEIEPRHIDETLYKMLEDGTKELTDELFFELILENPAYLSTRLFQKNINLVILCSQKRSRKRQNAISSI